MVGDAARHARAVDARQVVPRREIRRPLAQAGAAAAALLLVLAAGSDPLGRLGRTAWLYAFPYTAALHVEPGDARVPVGQPLRVSAAIAAAAGAPARTPPVVVMTDGGGTRQVVEMARASGGTYQLEIPAVEDSFSYRVRAAALESEAYDVVALRPPRVERIDRRLPLPAVHRAAAAPGNRRRGRAGAARHARDGHGAAEQAGGAGRAGARGGRADGAGARRQSGAGGRNVRGARRRHLPHRGARRRRAAEPGRHRLLHPGHRGHAARGADPASRR